MFVVDETKKNDRWDLMAWRVYGDAMRFGDIVAANPHLPIWDELPAGATFFAPLKEEEMKEDETQPIWRRDGN